MLWWRGPERSSPAGNKYNLQYVKPAGRQSLARGRLSDILTRCPQPYVPREDRTSTSWRMTNSCTDDIVVHSEDLGGTSRAVSQGARALTLPIRRVTTSLPEGLQAHLVEEERGLLLSWRLELSVQLSLLEGEALFFLAVPRVLNGRRGAWRMG